MKKETHSLKYRCDAYVFVVEHTSVEIESDVGICLNFDPVPIL